MINKIPTIDKLNIKPSQCMKVDGNSSPQGCATFVYFPVGETTPQWIIKVPRDPSFTTHLDQEVKILSLLQEDHKLRTIPTVVGHTQMGNSLAMVFSALSGQVMSRWIKRKNLTTALRLAAEWLAHFDKKTLVEQATLTERDANALVYNYLEPLLGEINTKSLNNTIVTDIQNIQTQIHQHLLKLCGVEMPITAIHGDFSMHNILTSDGQIAGVIDWTEARLEGCPFEDLLHFPIVIFTSRQFMDVNTVNTPNQTWQQIVSNSALLKDYLRYYCNIVKLDAALPLTFIPWYFLVTAFKELLPWRMNINSCKYWLNLARESIENPIR